jgi:hypothetical protein
MILVRSSFHSASGISTGNIDSLSLAITVTCEIE